MESQAIFFASQIFVCADFGATEDLLKVKVNIDERIIAMNVARENGKPGGGGLLRRL